jgi:uncharacterized protein YbbK (DUF523 family)
VSLPVIVISGCLAGLRVRYDGGSRPHPLLQFLKERAVLVPVCPELLGGLGIPRVPCHFVRGDGAAVLRGNAQVVDRDGNDRTPAFLRGAEETLRIVALVRPSLIVFKEGSPSCGVRRVDIEGTKQAGLGVVAALLRDSGISILSEEDPVPKLG